VCVTFHAHLESGGTSRFTSVLTATRCTTNSVSLSTCLRVCAAHATWTPSACSFTQWEVWTGLNAHALSCQQSSVLPSGHPTPTTASFTHHCILKPVFLNSIGNVCSTYTTVFSRSVVGAKFVQLWIMAFCPLPTNLRGDLYSTKRMKHHEQPMALSCNTYVLIPDYEDFSEQYCLNDRYPCKIQPDMGGTMFSENAGKFLSD
jgi:hypothetical protein